MRGKAKTGASRWKRQGKEEREIRATRWSNRCNKKDQKSLYVGDKCFTGDTLVYTRYGYKTIKEICKGDEVYSRDEKTICERNSIPISEKFKEYCMKFSNEEIE